MSEPGGDEEGWSASTAAGFIEPVSMEDDPAELFVAILHKRADVDRISPADQTSPRAPQSAFLRILAHNAEVPGLVELFSWAGRGPGVYPMITG